VNATLQEELLKLEPWDKNIEFQRKKCDPPSNVCDPPHLVCADSQFSACGNSMSNS